MYVINVHVPHILHITASGSLSRSIKLFPVRSVIPHNLCGTEVVKVAAAVADALYRFSEFLEQSRY